MLEGLLLEVMCKEELKRTITYDFMYISVMLVFFGPPCMYTYLAYFLSYGQLKAGKDQLKAGKVDS